MGNAFAESVEVRLKDDPEVRELIASALQETLGNLPASAAVFPLDISLYIKGTDQKVQPAAGTAVKITCPIPQELLAQREYLRVVCMIDGKLNVLETRIVQINGVYCAEFTASHFSPYAFVVDEAGALSASPAGEESDNPHTSGTIPATALLTLSAAAAVLNLKKKR